MRYNPSVNEIPIDSLHARQTSPAFRWTGRLAALLALIACVTLGVRQFTGADMGYHLYYGREFIQTGQIVTTNDDFIYRLPPKDLAPEQRPKPGPGAWYDEDGVYRFINANWGTQALIGTAWWLGGEDGVQWLRVGWTVVLFACLLAAMRRARAPWSLAGGAILLAAGAAYGQMHVRPGMLGMVVLAGQLVVLLPLTDPTRRVRRRDVIALVALQLLFVNIHSYFLLGVALTGTILIGRCIRWAWWRWLRRDARLARHVGRDAALSAAAVGGEILACLANPWTWRLAVMPIETLLYMRKHSIAGAEPGNVLGHPWSRIGELYSTWATLGTRGTLADSVLIVLLIAVAGSVLIALLHRRWALALMLGGIAMVTLSVRRNITPGALMLAPMIAVSVSLVVRWLAGRMHTVGRSLAGVAAAAAVCVLAVTLFVAAVTHWLFVAERSHERVGWGWNRIAVPVSAAEWINAHQPDGRMWTDFNSSSNLLWLTGRPTPGVTNTWAFPPKLMGEETDFQFGLTSYRAFDEMVRRRSVEFVVLQVNRVSGKLARNITGDPNWAVVDISPRHVTWLRTDGPNAELAARSANTSETLDVESLVARFGAADPVKHVGIYNGGLTLYHIGWYARAAEVIGASLKIAPDYHRAWLMRGECLGLAGTRRMLHGDPTGREELVKARQCFEHALRLKGGDYPKAAENLKYVNRQLAELEQGRILYPKDRLTPPDSPGR
jgi:hypothetical protein